MMVYKYFNKITWSYKWPILIYVIIFFIIAVIFSKNNIVNIKEDESYIKEQIFLEVVDAVIIIPETFDEKVIKKEEALIVYTDDRKPQAIQIQNQINKYIAFANNTYEEGQFKLEDVDSALRESVNVELVSKQAASKADSISEWFRYYFNFTGYVILAVYIAAIGLVMSDFTYSNIEMRRRLSSKTFLQFNKEIYLGQLTIAAFITFIFIMGRPQELLGDKVVLVAKFFPTYYFIRANNRTINSFLDIKAELFMQLLFAVAFILLGLIFSKKTQRA